MSSSLFCQANLRNGFVAVCLILAVGPNLCAQNGNSFNSTFFANRIGGIWFNVDGVVNYRADVLDANKLRQLTEAVASNEALASQKGVALRKVSLRGIYGEIEAAVNERRPISAEVSLMGGLQRIEFVFVDPKAHDIILAGPAEGWTTNEQGNVVGLTTGLPVLHLEDFIVAMRTSENANRDQGISCSINPTNEAAEKLSRMKDFIGQFNPAKSTMIEELGGPQMITITGIPTDSHYSQVLVAADYKMKRLSMGFEEAPVNNMPSYLDLAKRVNRDRGTSSPRFWMECNYLPLATTDDGLTWQLRGQGVKTLTEAGFIGQNGERQVAKRKDTLAEKWASTMTDQFDSLAAKEPVFLELRNLMDMSVVAALIAKENLLAKANLDIPRIFDGGKLDLPSYNVPKTVPTQCSFVKLTSSWLVTASGGVQVDSWSVADNQINAPELTDIRSKALASSNNAWWWN